MTLTTLVISALKTERGLALQDLLGGAYEYIETIDFKPHARVYLLDQLATTECVSFSRQVSFTPDWLCAADIGSLQAPVRRFN